MMGDWNALHPRLNPQNSENQLNLSKIKKRRIWLLDWTSQALNGSWRIECRLFLGWDCNRHKVVCLKQESNTHRKTIFGYFYFFKRGEEENACEFKAVKFQTKLYASFKTDHHIVIVLFFVTLFPINMCVMCLFYLSSQPFTVTILRIDSPFHNLQLCWKQLNIKYLINCFSLIRWFWFQFFINEKPHR